MHLIDTALRHRAEEGKPIRIGIIGAGTISRTLTRHIKDSVPGMRVVAIGNRTLEHAREAFADAGETDIVHATSAKAIEDAIHAGNVAITDNPLLLGAAGNIDCVLEATGTMEYGAQAVVAAIEGGKHIIMANAELDGTVGPALKVRADRAGVVYTGIDGDQPGAEVNLYRRVLGMGLTPRVCGNIKGFQNHYRNPTTQAAFAQQWGQSARMVSSFADGSKISFEQTVAANATGFGVAKRGMLGYTHDGHIDDVTSMYDIDLLREMGGIIDYVMQTRPGPGVYVFAEQTHAYEHRFLEYMKLGKGPLYSFYIPYHLCHLEVPFSIARAVLFKDETVTPIGAPVVEVIAVAKKDMVAGELLDEYGGYTAYGQCENATTVAKERLLPIGIAEGCTLKRDVKIDQWLTFDDVEVPSGRLMDTLYAEQQGLGFEKKILGQ
jgi:predicted homoserine dehydrogenase-like protein